MTDPKEMPQSSVLLIGGPDAGKSNYLFRLWIAINDGCGALSTDGLPNDVEYLRAGAERLLEGAFAGRTSKEVHERIAMPVRSNGSGPKVRRGLLVVPDMPGEQIRSIYRDRQWSPAWEEHISARCSCLIFVRAGSSENVIPLDWATCIEKYGAAIAPPHAATTEAPSASAGLSAPAGKQTDFKDGDSKNEIPTQVLLTDWMQFLRRAILDHAGGAHRPRVGVVVSAWDAVPTDQIAAGQEQYLKDNFPLLYQFVQTNGDHFDFQLFGVSVVSGDLKADVEFRKKYEAGNPRDFGFVIHSLHGEPRQDADMTLPVAWALGFIGANYK